MVADQKEFILDLMLGIFDFQPRAAWLTVRFCHLSRHWQVLLCRGFLLTTAGHVSKGGLVKRTHGLK
jgi:hypothetical protein